MDSLLLSLLACYGLVFFFQNKLWRPAKLPWLLETLLSCSFCLGFWTGLGLSLLRLGLDGLQGASIPAAVAGALTFGFASAAFSYTIDTAVRWLERES